jgi:hypothetical protein
MSNADSQNQECQGTVCESNFKPARPAKQTFENIKALAGELTRKVKETLTGEHEIVNLSVEETAKNRLLRMHQQAEENKSTTEAHVSMHSAEIIERFRQNNWNPQAGAYQPLTMSVMDQARSVPSQARAAEGRLKAGRYDNPWRYDNRH